MLKSYLNLLFDKRIFLIKWFPAIKKYLYFYPITRQDVEVVFVS